MSGRMFDWLTGGSQQQYSYPGIPTGTQEISQFSIPGTNGAPATIMSAPVAGAGGVGSPVNTDNIGFGANIGTGRLALGAVQGIGNLYNSWQAQGMANKQFEFTKNLAQRNLANSIQSYNTRLEGTARARGITEGQPASVTAEYLDRNRLAR